MKLLFLSHVQNAQQSLKSNRMRSVLTILGMAIGVASITAILALSSGASKIVSDQVEALGGNIAVVRPGAPSETPFEDIAQFPTKQYYTASTLTNYDLETIQALPGVEAAAPLMILTGGVSGESNAPLNTPIVATTPEFATISDLGVRDGQFLDPSLSINTAVIGAQLSVNIFGTEQSIGKIVTIKGEPFTIIGILKRTNSPINYNGVNFDAAVIVNRETSGKLNQDTLQIQQINIRSTSVETLDDVIVYTNKQLLKNHFDEQDFTVLSGDQIAQPTSQLFLAIAGTTAAVAAISLIVGGIGIMNIMLVSVAERTREIGIRKALGATNGNIVWQFIIESLALSIGGGISGYLVGYLAAFAISTFLPFDPLISWQTAALALGLSITIGTLFGLYPAIRAARKDPIDALRQYD